MRLVILESPFAASTPEGVLANISYARACMRDCLMRGDAPYASYLLYTQVGVLDDDVPNERALGIEAGLLWGAKASATVVYVDRGVSRGMRMGIERAEREGRPIEWRWLETPRYVPKQTLLPPPSVLDTPTPVVVTLPPQARLPRSKSGVFHHVKSVFTKK